MIIPDFEKLYEPYTANGGTIDGATRWLQKVTGAGNEIVEAVIAETFVELASGKSFLGPCECGCEISNAHTKIEHYMRDKCFELKKEADKAYSETVQKNIQARILSHIQAENDQFIAENTKPRHPFLDWSKSETINLYKKIRGK